MIFYLIGILSFSLTAQDVPNEQKPLFTKITATWCPNCGTWGWTYMKDIIGQNGDEMLVVGAHYSGDLQNAAGGFFDQVLQAPGQPVFYLNNDNQGVRSNNLSAKLAETDAMVKQITGEQPLVGVGMEVQPSQTSITVRTKTKFFNATDGEYYLGLYLIEDGVVADQASVGSNAVHPMVARAIFSDQGEGVQLADGAIAADTEMENEFTLVRQPEWNLDNSYVYGIIWKRENGGFIYQNGNSVDVMDVVISTEDERLLNEVKVFPTVSEGTYQIELPGSMRNHSITITDKVGQRFDYVLTSTSDRVHVVNLSAMPVGQYFIRLEYGDALKTFPVIKQ